MNTKINIGILDDHELFRKGIVEIINHFEDCNVKLSVGTMSSLYRRLNEIDIDILLLDIRLKEGSGFEVLNKLKEEYPHIKIIVLSMHTESAYINTMIRKGAKGYNFKDISPEELKFSIMKVYKDGSYYPPHIAKSIIEGIQAKEELIHSGISISDQELELLRLLSRGKTTDEISTEIFKSRRTVEGYRQKLLDKTGCKNIAELISWSFRKKIIE